MKSFICSIKYFLIAAALFVFKDTVAQNPANWGLQRIGAEYYQTTANLHNLITKVKYTSKNFKCALFNSIRYYDNAALSINQLNPLDYKNWNFLQWTFLKKEDVLIPFWATPTYYAKDFDTDVDDNFIVLGDSKVNITDSSQIVICKATPDNVKLWTKIYGGSSAEYAIAIKKTADNNFIILAQTQSNDGDVTNSNGGKDIWLFKINNLDGSIIWKKTIGSNVDEIPTDFDILKDGSIIVSGAAAVSPLFSSTYTGLNSFLLKCDASGNVQWTKVFGGSGADKITAFAPIESGGFVSISTTTSANGDYPVNVGGSDVYIFKHDVTGNIIWQKHYGFADDDVAGDIAVTPCEELIYASWSKQFNGTPKSFAIFPDYSQTSGMRVALQNTGNQIYLYQDNFTYPPSYNTGSLEIFNEGLTTAIVSNNKGGILTADIGHAKHNEARAPYAGTVTREMIMFEYGIIATKISVDTNICKGQSIGTVVIQSDTTFIDTLRNNCLIDTAIYKYKIHVLNADSLIIVDTTICYGSNYKGVIALSSFIENDTVLITNTFCGPKFTIKKIRVTVTPKIINQFGKDTTLCPLGSIVLKAYQPAISYLWQDNSTNSNFNTLKEGKYWVEVTDTFKCSTRDTITIIKSTLFLNKLGDTTIRFPQTVQLNPQTNGTVLWALDAALSCTICQSTIASPTDTQKYLLSATKDNCTLNSEVKVTVIKSFFLYVPDAFTPNSDTRNDVFKVYINSTNTFRLEIYNRYGEKIFVSIDPSKGWDGTYKGSKQPIGVYNYIIVYQTDTKQQKSIKGSIVLIR